MSDKVNTGGIHCMPLTSLGDALGSRMAKVTPLRQQVAASMVVEFAILILKELLGDEQGSLAKPLFLKNKTLTITCASSVVAQEVRLHQAEILDKIKNKFGEKIVDRIRYLA